MANSVTLSSAAMSNLLSLNNTSSLIDRTQTRLSTGRAVNSALDDAMAFFKARNLTNRAGDLNTVKADIDNGLNVVKTATEALGQVETFLTQAKAAANSARAEKDPAIRATYINQINETLSKMVDLASDANYDGINLVQAVADIDMTSTAGSAAKTVVESATKEAFASQALTSAVSSGSFTSTDGVNITVTGAGAGSFTGTVAASFTNASNDKTGADFGETGNATLGAVKELNGKFYMATSAGSAGDGSDSVYREVTVDAAMVSAGAAVVNTADSGYQDTLQAAVNTEVRSNPGTYQDKQGFTAPEKLTVVFSEQDRSRRLDVQAKALGDLLSGIVKGTSAVQINAADWTASDGKSPDTNAIDAFTAQIDTAARQVRAYTAELGNYSQIMSVRGEFTDNMVNTLKGGAADLVNADMNAESANMLALQTRQQLGVIALSIAQQSEQAVLRLF